MYREQHEASFRLRISSVPLSGLCSPIHRVSHEDTDLIESILFCISAPHDSWKIHLPHKHWLNYDCWPLSVDHLFCSMFSSYGSYITDVDRARRCPPISSRRQLFLWWKGQHTCIPGLDIPWGEQWGLASGGTSVHVLGRCGCFTGLCYRGIESQACLTAPHRSLSSSTNMWTISALISVHHDLIGVITNICTTCQWRHLKLLFLLLPACCLMFWLLHDSTTSVRSDIFFLFLSKSLALLLSLFLCSPSFHTSCKSR